MSSEPVIYVVDDDPSARTATAGIINQIGLNVQLFTSAQALLRCVGKEAHGCVVTELDLPDASGLELQAQLRRTGSLLPVIFYTARPSVTLAVTALKRGAVDLLVKDCPASELQHSVRSAIDAHARRRDEHRFLSLMRNRMARLTSEETRLMDLLLKGCPKKKIAAEMNISLRTIDFRRAALLKKMGVDSVVDLIKSVSLARFHFNGQLHSPAAELSGESCAV